MQEPDNPAAETADLLWGAAAIARFLGRTPRQVFWMLENGTLPAKKVGKIWVGERSRLRAFFVEEVA